MVLEIQIGFTIYFRPDYAIADLLIILTPRANLKVLCSWENWKAIKGFFLGLVQA